MPYRCFLIAAGGYLALALLGCPTYTDYMGDDPEELEQQFIDPDMGTGVLACTQWEYALWEPEEGCATDRPCSLPMGWEPFGPATEFEGQIQVRRCLTNE